MIATQDRSRSPGASLVALLVCVHRGLLQLASVNSNLLAERALGGKTGLAMASKSDFADMLLEDSGTRNAEPWKLLL